MTTVLDACATHAAQLSTARDSCMRAGRRARPPECGSIARTSGFTLIELLTALLVLSLLALMSYRGLGAVLDAREHVTRETGKWRHVTTFFARFERDLRLAAPRPTRIGTGPGSGSAPAWLGKVDEAEGSSVEFNRFAPTEDMDVARRIAYRLNERREVELLLWPGLDVAPTAVPARYAVLSGVSKFDLRYLNHDLAWVTAWPVSSADTAIPLAVQLRVVLATGEEIVRVFDLGS